MPDTGLTTQTQGRLTSRSTVQATPGARPVEDVARVVGEPGTGKNEPGQVEPTESREASGEVRDVNQTVERLNELVQSVRRELRFSVNDESGNVVITVINADTQEVVRQIPPEEVVGLVERLSESRPGLMVDAKA